MELLINDIYEIIKDYREDEQLMNRERIKNWISQFDVDDRLFVLEEMKHILSQRYISKETAKTLVKGMIEYLVTYFKYSSPNEFLLKSQFIDNQPDGKSQKELLKFLDEIIQTEYSISIADCNTLNPKYYIYFDDILCTGDTLVKGLSNTKGSRGWFNKINDNGKSNLEVFQEDQATLVLAYFCVHKLNIQKAYRRLWFEMNKQNIDIVYAWNEVFNIQNDIDNASSSLDFFYPVGRIVSGKAAECQRQIETNLKNCPFPPKGSMKFREPDKPIVETLFTSATNRERFEKIILGKCADIYIHSETLKSNIRARPLGYGLQSDLNLGFGALIFTWRNVPFNVPLVFWYHDHEWTPLFERKFIHYENSTSETTLKSIAQRRIKSLNQNDYNSIRYNYILNRKKPGITFDELFELDLNFLEEITGIEKRYWENGYMNAPSLHKYFDKLKQDKLNDNFTINGFEAWAKGCISGQSILYAYVIKNNLGIVYETLKEISTNILESKGVGKGSAINTIMLGEKNR